MSINLTATFRRVDVTGTTASVTFDFQIERPEDLIVRFITDADPDPDPLEFGVDYTVAGGFTDTGGGVNFTPSIEGDGVVEIQRKSPVVQDKRFRDADKFPAESVERGIDRATMVLQEHQTQIDRTIRFTLAEPALKPFQPEANMFLAFDGDKQPINSPGPTGVPVHASLANFLSGTNSAWLTGGNAAATNPLNMWRINAFDFLEFGTTISWDNTGLFIDRGVPFYQVTYRNLAPTKLHFATFVQMLGAGDNALPLKGVGAHFISVEDDPSVDTDAERPALYGITINIKPNRTRTNSPADDATGFILTNVGPGRGTEGIFIGRNPHPGAPSRDWHGAIGIESHSIAAIWAIANFDYGLDFSRGLATPATFTGAAMRTPNAVTAVAARNQANNADLALLATNSSNQMVLGGAGVARIITGNGVTIAFDEGAFTNSQFEIANTNAGAIGAFASMFHDSSTPAANDSIAVFNFFGRDNAANKQEYAQILIAALDVTAGSEDGEIQFNPHVAGANVGAVKISNGMLVGNPTGGYKGHGAINAAQVHAGALFGHVQDLNAAGAVNLTTTITKWGTTGAQAGTLADGTEGQLKLIMMDADGGDGTLTPTNFGDGTSITFNDVGDAVILAFLNADWWVFANKGCTINA